jgi:hypothetical protein
MRPRGRETISEDSEDVRLYHINATSRDRSLDEGSAIRSTLACEVRRGPSSDGFLVRNGTANRIDGQLTHGIIFDGAYENTRLPVD